MSAVDELRSTRTKIRILQDELTQLNELIKNHPAKPLPSEQTVETMGRWASVKEPLYSRRLELKSELKPLQDRVAEIQRALNQAPVSRVTLGKMIDRLTDLEATFATKGHATAWDDLISLLDYLEYEEARMSVEGQVAKLEAVA